tara:strand:+ start:13364 stop:13777 length:414 start_codon:yes stop_codon:yes gene_type:complete
MQCQIVDPRLIDHVWPKVETWIERAIAKGDRWWTLSGIKERVLSDPSSALFVMIDDAGFYGVFVVCVETKPNGEREAIVPACGGKNMKSWIGEIGEIENWSRSQGAKFASITGRKGWPRVLASSGYKITAVTVEKAL